MEEQNLRGGAKRTARQISENPLIIDQEIWSCWRTPYQKGWDPTGEGGVVNPKTP